MSKRKKILYLMLCFLIIIGLWINWAFFDTQRIQGEELLESADSPNKNYTVSAYLNNGGATTDKEDYRNLIKYEKSARVCGRNSYTYLTISPSVYLYNISYKVAKSVGDKEQYQPHSREGFLSLSREYLSTQSRGSSRWM